MTTAGIVVMGILVGVVWTNNMKMSVTAAGLLLAGVGLTFSTGNWVWTWSDIPALALLVVALVATIPRKSQVLPTMPPTRWNGILPNITRCDGVLTLIGYLGLFLLAKRVDAGTQQWMLRGLVLVATGVSTVAILQFFGRIKLCLPGGVPDGAIFQGRSWGTMANPLFLGGYLCMTIPLALMLREGWAEACVLPMLAALVVSKSRAAWGAMAVVLPVTWMLTTHPMLWFAPFATAVSVASITGWWKTNRLETAFFDLLGAKESGRRYIWNLTWQKVREKPWIGWGLNTMQLPNPDPTARDHYDKAHNVLLQVAYETGAIGLVCYLTLWGIAFHGAGMLLPSLLGYAIWSQFAWDHLGPANAMWLLLGIAASR